MIQPGANKAVDMPSEWIWAIAFFVFHFPYPTDHSKNINTSTIRKTCGIPAEYVHTHINVSGALLAQVRLQILQRTGQVLLSPEVVEEEAIGVVEPDTEAAN